MYRTYYIQPYKSFFYFNQSKKPKESKELQELKETKEPK